MGPLLACISLFGSLLIFTRFLFLAFFKKILENFPLISGVSTNESSSSHNQFAKIFVCVCPEYTIIRIRKISASSPPSDTGGPKFSPVATGVFVGLAPQTKF